MIESPESMKQLDDGDSKRFAQLEFVSGSFQFDVQFIIWIGIVCAFDLNIEKDKLESSFMGNFK